MRYTSEGSKPGPRRSCTQMPGTVPLEVRIALDQLVNEFAYLVDFGPSETIADLFVEDGWYGWGDKRSVGREAIRNTYRARAARGLRTSRHLNTNQRLTMAGDNEARGQSIWLIFAEDGPPPHPAVPLLVADVHDVYVHQDGRWLFQSRQLDDVFVAPDRKAVLPLSSTR